MKVNLENQRSYYLLKLARRILVENPGNYKVSIDYCRKFVNLVKSKQLRLSPELRSMICRKCYLIQIPGLSCSFRLRSHRNKHLVVSCFNCQSVKRFRTDNPAFSRQIFCSSVQRPSQKNGNEKLKSTSLSAGSKSKPHICLFKSETEPDEYKIALEAAGFVCSRIPMQRMFFVNEKELNNLLFGDETHNFQSVLVASVNAVRAIERLCDNETLAMNVRKLWSNRACFTVGKKTRSTLERLGFRVQHVFQDGEDVSVKMASVLGANAALFPILYLTGDGTGSNNRDVDFAGEELVKLKLPHHSQLVFTVQANTKVKEEYTKARSELGRPEVIIFFSPQTTAQIVDDISLKNSDDLKSTLIAVGEPTAAVMRGLEIPVAAAVQPNVKNIKAALADKYPEMKLLDP